MRKLLLLASLAACSPVGSTGALRGQASTLLAVGARHFCARATDGTLRCFGDNSAGQLGQGHTDPVVAAADAGEGPPRAVIVQGLLNVAEIAAGTAHTCVRLEDGTVRCFGENAFGQIGDGTIGGVRALPVILPGVRDVRALTAGGAHTCAIRADKTVTCWGRNDDGQLGDGSTTTRLVPVPVSGLSEVEQIVAGTFHTCARLGDGSVRCWGRNDGGQIGDGTIGTPRPTPTRVSGLEGAEEIVAALADTCARMPDKTLRCWGRASARSAPIPVLGFRDVVEVGLGSTPTSFQLCARLIDKTLRCTAALTDAPQLVPGIVNAIDLAVGAELACARLDDGSLRCFSRGSVPQSIVL